MFPILQWSKEPPKTTPEASLTITENSWGRPKWIPSPGIPEHSPSQQWPWSAVRWGHQRLKPALQALTLGHEPALRCFYLKRLWKVSPIHMVLQASGTITYCWSFQETTDFWTSSQPSESRWTAKWVQLQPLHELYRMGGTWQLQFALSSSWMVHGQSYSLLFPLFHYFCKRDRDLAGVNVIWPVWLLFNSQLSLSQPANSQLITASQQIQSLHQAREF